MIGLQIVIVLYLNLSTMIYIASAQALEGKEFNQIDLINSTIVSIITFNVVCFSEFV